MALSDAIADLQAHPPRRGPSCTSGVAIRTLTDADQQAIYTAGDQIAAHNSTITWRDLAKVIADETGADMYWERLSRHCRRQCACWR